MSSPPYQIIEYSDEESDIEFADAEENVELQMEEVANEESPGADAEETDEQFDISLPATHSYLSNGLVSVPGRSVLEAGWRGRVPCVGHHSVVYPGETVPMVMTHPRDCDLLNAAIQSDKLFGLLFAEQPEVNNYSSGYGVLCEVFEATVPQPHSVSAHSLAFKARARHRFRFNPTPSRQTINTMQVRLVDIVILPEVEMSNPFKHSRLLSLDHLRSTECKRLLATIQQMDAVVTNWPPFVFDICSFHSIARVIYNYFSGLNYEALPSDMVSLSFWAASNLPLSYKLRLELFKEDNALQRLRVEAKFVQEQYYILCCQGCGGGMETQIAKCEDIFAMSSEGMKSNYCNLGGYVHDIMTVSKIDNVRPSGPPSTEFSWFPGYMWTILVCKHCGSHIGWRFTATKKSFQRQTFYAICRNKVFPYSR